jgi:hypothetical protein
LVTTPKKEGNMSQYKFTTDVSEPMFGSFTKEYPDQFTTKRKNNTIHLFKIVSISDDGLSIKSLLDKHVDIVPFAEITKIKNHLTGEIVKVEKFGKITKEELVQLFLNKGEEPITLYVTGESNELTEKQFNEFTIKSGTVYVVDAEGTSTLIESIVKKEADISFG